MQFKVGDRVRWTSQAQGSTRTKEGRIEHVIPAGGNAKKYIWTAGLPRDHESYIVGVSGPRGGHKRYWPLVKNLERLEP